MHAIEERLQKPPLVAAAEANASIEGWAEHEVAPRGWHAVLDVRNSAGAVVGRREFDSSAPSCTELRDSVALAIALMIDPDAVLHRLTSPPPLITTAPVPTATVSTATTATPATSITREPEPALMEAPHAVMGTRRPWRVTPTASASLMLGLLPTASPGFLADFDIHPPSFWAVDLLGGIWGTETAFAPRGASAAFSLASLGVAVCPATPTPGRFGGKICTGFLMGGLRGAGQGFSISQSDTGFLADLLGSAAFVAPLGGVFGLQLRLDLGLSLYRDRFVYFDAQGSHNVFEPSALFGSLSAGPSVSIP
jgi:hypothetical protein